MQGRSGYPYTFPSCHLLIYHGPVCIDWCKVHVEWTFLPKQINILPLHPSLAILSDFHIEIEYHSRQNHSHFGICQTISFELTKSSHKSEASQLTFFLGSFEVRH